MWNLQDDKELDKLSREAADNYSVDRTPDSWNKVHLRLEAEMPTERRRRYLLFFLLFLFVGSGIFWLNRMNVDDAQKQEIAEQPVASKGEMSENNKVKNSTNSNQELAVPSPVGENSAATNKSRPTSEQENTTQKPITSTNNSQENSVTGKRQNGLKGPLTTAPPYKKKESNRSVKNQKDGAEKTADLEGAVNEKKTSPEGDQKIDSKESESPSPSDNSNQDAQNDSKKDVKDEAVSQDNTSTSKAQNEKPKVNSRWTFGAVYAPDISTVKFTHREPIGLNIGVLVEYKLSKKFSLQSGLIYTKKNYKLNGEDYHPPKGTWFDYVHMKDVTGYCTMFDVPINVRFNAVRKKTSNIFFGAGLSTYLMNQENYSFFYYYNGVPTTRNRTYEENTEHLFSILNISAGYEKKLSNVFSLQVEPFFKQPLSGIGFGDISLNSAGVYFSLRYNPLKRVSQSVTAKK